MAVACGHGFTVLVTEQGDVWACGRGNSGQLGLGDNAHQLLPASVGGREVFAGEPLVMMATGRRHTAGVTKDGALWSWGEGYHGQLGHGDRAPRQRPERLDREMFGGSPAVMVACGGMHTIVLTDVGCVWSCGLGDDGRLGHGNQADQLMLALVASDQFRGAHIVMVAAGRDHSMALDADGSVWTWGYGNQGQLGLNDEQHRLLPTKLDCKVLGGAAAVLVAGGYAHTVAVTVGGALWIWGNGFYGQLGLGDKHNRMVPVRVGAEGSFGESQVLMAACGNVYTLAVTKAGTLWAWGKGAFGKLGHNDENNRLVPTQVEAQHFGYAKIVSAAAGVTHTAAITEHGTLYTWGKGSHVKLGGGEGEVPGGLGHCACDTKLVPTLVVMLQGVRVGCCHGLPPMHALAFAMGNHPRLGRAAQIAPAVAVCCSVLQCVPAVAPASTDNGTDCEYVSMPGELVQRIVEACGGVSLEGVVRLLGGGMLNEGMPTCTSN